MATEEQIKARAKWVEALRSGKYKQANGNLAVRNHYPDEPSTISYCCLGVAVVVLGAEPEGVWFNGGTLNSYQRVMRQLGLRNDQGTYDTTIEDPETGTRISVSSCLTKNNDSDGMSFSEIADVIESNPYGLFID